MLVLVTGGSGFLGNRLIEVLLETGYAVRALSRRELPVLQNKGVSLILSDLADKKKLKEATAGVEAVFHVAGKTGIWGPLEEFIETNLNGTQNLVEASLASKVRYFIYTSSPSVVYQGKDLENVDESVPYLEKSSDNYSFSKMLAEKYVLSQDSDSFKTLALRPHLIWGPKDPHFLPRLQKLSTTKKLKLFSGGPYLIDTTYIDSAVEAHVKAFEKLAAGAPVNGKAYFISQNEPLDVSDFIGLLLKVMDLPPVKPSVPPGLGRAMGSLCETLWKIFNLKEEPPLTKFSAQQLTTHHYFNVGKAKSFLGYGPEKTLKDGLRELALYLKQTKKNLESI